MKVALNPFEILMSTAFVVSVGLSPCFGQDSHYWTNQFGNRARLLGGAVIGSTDDLSAVYYNPGGLALVEKSEILLAVMVRLIWGCR